ncbi:hypothetical protein H2204_005021 [Knufia peltigerae]|uniref:3-oxoacyl-[acyl-carrier protein] reductase n=1 Tax=Knufia peltigerae TaxID=1002370 RepID=A0AA38Y7V3_9EURO|nr:hypothetical protein H2204_005021 [Knufia peltigerae]
MADATPTSTFQQPKTLLGKTAVISGSSTGIGAAIARELSARGANIVLNYPFPDLRADCEAVGNTLLTSWIAVCADLSTMEGPQVLVDAAVKRFDHIHILVNNAAIVPHGPTWEIDATKWDRAMNLNARGTFFLTKAALPHLTPYKLSSPAADSGVLGGSRIICIGSGAGRLPQPGLIAYAATKGALESMIKNWAKELPPVYGCTVNGVAPGPVNTETFRKSFAHELDEVKVAFSEATPCEGSLADEDDIAWTVAFLAEPRSKWINGEYINVNGGHTIV